MVVPPPHPTGVKQSLATHRTCLSQPRSEGSLLHALRRAGRRKPRKRGCVYPRLFIFGIPPTTFALPTSAYSSAERFGIFSRSAILIQCASALAFVSCKDHRNLMSYFMGNEFCVRPIYIIKVMAKILFLHIRTTLNDCK